MTLFVIAALRAVVEMLGYCLIGRGLLALINGERRDGNPIYALLKLITQAPCQCVARCLPGQPGGALVGVLTFLLLLLVWVGLAILRKFI